MRVKSQYYLQPTVADAHSVIVEDRFGNILFVAVEADAGNIVTAQAGDENFSAMLKALGIDKITIVHDIKSKPIDAIRHSM
jgi:hypothetical protein